MGFGLGSLYGPAKFVWFMVPDLGGASHTINYVVGPYSVSVQQKGDITTMEKRGHFQIGLTDPYNLFACAVRLDYNALSMSRMRHGFFKSRKTVIKIKMICAGACIEVSTTDNTDASTELTASS